jgi:hypothetical protein
VKRFLIIVFWGLVACYAAALFLFAIGTFGWFGQDRDPLSGVFLIPLGLPWNQLLDGASDAILPWVGILSPLLNIAILGWCIRRFANRG